MFRIGYRTLKTSIGTPISILLAQIFQLQNFVSAGILTILCIQVTKKRSLISSWARFAACVIAMGFSFVFFEGIGYHVFSIGLLLVFFIPTLVMLKIQEGVVTSSVIILHFYTKGNITLPFVINEFGIIVIGIGVALLMNLYMPSVDRELKGYQSELERLFKRIFQQIAIYLREGDSQWDGREITEAAEIIDKAKGLSLRNVENQLLRNEDYYYRYFRMREKQFEIIERLLPIVTSLSKEVKQGKMLADFMEELSVGVHPGNTAHIYLNRLNELMESYRNMQLPKTREEFEIRASLYNFVNEMEQYLIIKRYFKASDA